MTTVETARTIADDLLWNSATSVDKAASIPDSHFQTLATAGLFGTGGMEPPGSATDAPTTRMIQRILGSGCGATTFVFAQHHGLVGQLNHTTNQTLRTRWYGRLCRGEALAGIMFAHLRRPGAPVLSALRNPADDGWVISGHAPWATSWNIADVYLIAAMAPGQRVVWFVAELPGNHRTIEAELIELPVLMATRTARVTFDELSVPDADVVSVMERHAWAERDLLRAASPNPAALGLGDRVLSLLEAVAPRVASRVGAQWQDLVGRAEESGAQVDQGAGTEREHSEVRAEVMESIVRLATALLAAEGGRGVELSNPTQRLFREAMFYIVQAQTTAGRTATLDRLHGFASPS